MKSDTKKPVKMLTDKLDNLTQNFHTRQEKSLKFIKPEIFMTKTNIDFFLFKAWFSFFPAITFVLNFQYTYTDYAPFCLKVNLKIISFFTCGLGSCGCIFRFYGYVWGEAQVATNFAAVLICLRWGLGGRKFGLYGYVWYKAQMAANLGCMDMFEVRLRWLHI